MAACVGCLSTLSSCVFLSALIPIFRMQLFAKKKKKSSLFYYIQEFLCSDHHVILRATSSFVPSRVTSLPHLSTRQHFQLQHLQSTSYLANGSEESTGRYHDAEKRKRRQS